MILFLYILRDYLRYVLGTVLLTVFLFTLFDFIQRSTKEFGEYRPATEKIVYYYLYQVPGQVMQAMPIAALLASVISMIMLSRTNEITAMRAAGMGPRRIGAPLACGGVLLSLAALVIGEALVPRLAKRVHHVHEVEIMGERDDQIAGGARWLRTDSTLINFRDYDAVRQSLSHLQIIDVRVNFRPDTVLQAESAIYRPERRLWELQDVRRLRFRPSGTLDRIDPMSSPQFVALPVEPTKLKRDRRTANELSIAELKDLVDRGDASGANTLPYKVELQGKLAYPFAALVVSLIGLKFGYKSERATETTKGVLIAFAIGISYWFVMSAGRALGLRGDIPPIVAAWLPNFVILGIIATEAYLGRRG